MNSKSTQTAISIISILLAFAFFVFVLDMPLYMIFTIIASAAIIFVFTKFFKPIAIYITIILVIINVIMLLFAIIPSYDQQVDARGFYDDQQNYIQVSLDDSTDLLTKAQTQIVIFNPDRDPAKQIHNLYDMDEQQAETNQIQVFSGDLIFYKAKTKELQTVVNLYLWDGTILRILPQTKITMSKILKNTQDLLDSQTHIKLNQGEIRFNVVKTIVDDDSFNITTNNGTIVIRGTAGMAMQEQGQTFVYSNDHVIEVINNAGDSKLIAGGDLLQVFENKFQEMNPQELVNILGTKIYKNVYKAMTQEFQKLDALHISSYKDQFQNYIQDNFSWSLDGSNTLEQLGERKLKIGAMFFPEYQDKLNNYLTYKSLLGQKTIDNIGYKDKLNQYIFTPVNQNWELMKMQFMDLLSKSETVQGTKTAIINAYNKALDMGKDVDLSNLKSVRGEIKSGNYREDMMNTYQKLYDQILNQF